MAEVWVTMLSCSECLRRHEPHGAARECDCWCHDGDDEQPDDYDDQDWYYPSSPSEQEEPQ